MSTVEERLSVLEERSKSQHDMLVEIKLLLEGLQPFQIRTTQVQEWQASISEIINNIRHDHNGLKDRVAALELWRSYLLGGMTVIMALAGTGLVTALLSYLTSRP